MAIMLKNPAATSYFSSLSQMNRKVFEESRELHNRQGWDTLSIEEQEKCFDELFIPKAVDSDYDSDDQETQRFPDLKVKCGEKIVVDFENEDGWTWTDEHSGPFSWMTRSQQDLTLDELYRDDANAKERKGQQMNRPPSFADQPLNVKGFDDSLFSSSVPGEMSEIEAAFQKFGISIPADDDMIPVLEESSSAQDTEIDIVFSTHYVDESQNGDLVQETSTESGFQESKDSSFYSDLSSSPEQTLQTKASKRSLNSFLKWPWGKKKHNQKSDYTTMSLPLGPPQIDQSTLKELSGHVSPVFVGDESPRVITDQPKSMLETYDNVSSYEQYNQSNSFDERSPHEGTGAKAEGTSTDFQLSPPVPSDYIMTSQSTAIESNLTCNVSTGYPALTDEITKENETPGIYIEPVGESTDYAVQATMDHSKDISKDADEALDISKSGFDFLDNW